MSMRPRVSVIVPTYHRPQSLRAAVESVMGQHVPDWEVEVIIALSDPRAPADVAAADELASDGRVRVVGASRPGPAAARNAGIVAADGTFLALVDDDCIAQEGWLQAGLSALAHVELVQGRTRPIREPTGHDRFIAIDEISYLWEACNLFVRRSAVDRAGLFDETLNPTGRAGGHFGEDIEWGWRLVRNGASYTYARDALVHHAVESISYGDFLKGQLRLRWFPLALRRSPELRRKFYLGYFLARRHAVITGSWSLVAAGGAARVAGARRTACGAFLAAAVLQLAWWRHARSARQLLYMMVRTPQHLLANTVEVGALLYGSIRYRRLLL
jgi:glycosyltransferase involved in cell wall biosynthesis